MALAVVAVEAFLARWRMRTREATIADGGARLLPADLYTFSRALMGWR